MDDLRLCDYENLSRDNVIEFRFEKAQVKKARTKYAPRIQEGTEYPKGDNDCTRSSKNIYSDAENFSTIPILNAYRKCHVMSSLSMPENLVSPSNANSTIDPRCKTMSAAALSGYMPSSLCMPKIKTDLGLILWTGP